MILYMLFIAKQSFSIQFNNITNNTGLLFMKTNIVSIPNSHKILKINLNVTYFLLETSILQSNIDNITDICENKTSNPNCNYFNQHIEHNSNKLIEIKKRLFPNTRTKSIPNREDFITLSIIVSAIE